jgi:hypothetical protein
MFVGAHNIIVFNELRIENDPTTHCYLLHLRHFFFSELSLWPVKFIFIPVKYSNLNNGLLEAVYDF